MYEHSALIISDDFQSLSGIAQLLEQSNFRISFVMNVGDAL